MGDPVKHLVLLRAIRDWPMSNGEYAVLTKLVLFGDEDGTSIKPGKRTIATSCEMKLRGIDRIYKKLSDKGYIIGDGWANRRKKWKANAELFLAGPPNKVKKPKVERSKPPAAPPVPPKPVVPPAVIAPLSEEEELARIAKRHEDAKRVQEMLKGVGSR